MSLKVTSRQLPEGWTERKLEDIATFRNGLNFTQNSKGESIKLVGVKDFQNNFWVQEDQLEFVTIDGELKEIDALRQGDILTVRSNGNKDLIGRCVLVGDLSQKTSHSGFTIRIRLEREDVYPSFLIHLLKSRDLREQLTNSGGGINISSLNQQSLSQLKIRFPSLPEQKRIVEILDEAFEGIDRAIANTEKNLVNARELFESYLNAILSGQGKQWKETTLGKEIDLLTGFAFKSSGYTDSSTSIRLLRGDNITPGSLRWDGVKKWPESEVNEYLPYQLREGDVVLAMDRPWIKTGLRRAQISKDDLPCLLVQRTACLRGGENLENRFLLYLISSRSFTQHVLGSQTGLSVPHISGKQIQSFKFNKPSLREQYSIIDSLDELRLDTQRLEAIYQQKLVALNELKQSILQKAFTGELTAESANQTIKTAKEGIAAA